MSQPTKASVTVEHDAELQKEAMLLIRNTDILPVVLQEIEKVVKNDYTTKLSVLFTALSAYLHEPLNLFISGASGLGKSYNTTKTLEFFPEEDIWFLGGMSPTALIHDHGVKKTSDGRNFDEIPVPEKPQRSDFDDKQSFFEAYSDYKQQLKSYREIEKASYNLIDLQGKTLVFLESPHLKTFQILRPILSHDKWQMSFKITDKTSSGSLQTKHVVLQGWPATIFLKATDEYLEELATRSFTVSPTRDKEKYALANELATHEINEPWFEDNRIEQITRISKAIRLIKGALQNHDVVVPFAGLQQFYPAEIPRDMRDFRHLTQFIRCVAAFHCAQRVMIKRAAKEYYAADSSDVLLAWELFNALFETTRTGVSQHLLDFYHGIIETRESWTAEELTTEYNKVFQPKKSKKTIYKHLEILQDLGYTTCEQSSEDKRQKIYKPIIKSEISPKRLDSGMRRLSGADLETAFENWLNKSSHELQFYNRQKIQNGDVTSESTKYALIEDREKLKEFISQFHGFGDYLSGIISTLKTEKNRLTLSISENGLKGQILHAPSTPLKEVVSIAALTPEDVTRGICPLCNSSHPLEFSATYTDGAWGDICYNCGMEIQKRLASAAPLEATQ